MSSSEVEGIATAWFAMRADIRALAQQQTRLKKELTAINEQLVPAMKAAQMQEITVDGKRLVLEDKLTER